MTTTQGPTGGRRRLRNALRKARESTGLTQDQVAAAMDWSLSKLIRIEAGTVSVSTNDAKALLQHYGLRDANEVRELVDLARLSRKRAWWTSYKDSVPQTPFYTYLGLEAEAVGLSIFQPVAMPGLLQTESYAKALIMAAVPNLVSAGQVETVVALRKRRQQEVLRRTPAPRVEVILDEASLHREIGGVEVLRDQLLHLVKIGGEPHVFIRVLPFSVSRYSALGQFIIVHFAEPEDTDVVYAEGASATTIVDQPAMVKPYQEAFQSLLETAMSHDDSLQMISTVAAQLGRDG